MDTSDEIHEGRMDGQIHGALVRGNPCLLTDAAISEIAFEAQVSEQQAWAVLSTTSGHYCSLQRLMLDRLATRPEATVERTAA